MKIKPTEIQNLTTPKRGKRKLKNWKKYKTEKEIEMKKLKRFFLKFLNKFLLI